MTDQPAELGPRRENVPDLNLVAEHLLDDLRDEPPPGYTNTGEHHLDAVGTLTGLTEDDLVELVVLLARRLVDAERESDR